MYKHIAIVGNTCLINNVSFGKNPKVFLVAVTQILGHMTQFTHCSSFKFSNVMLANMFVEYFNQTSMCF
jgi:hypothetical protein